MGDLPEECLLCPVRAARAYLEHTSSIAPQRPTCPLVKNALSFFLRRVILDTGAVEEGAWPPRAHSVRAVATLAAFLRKWSVSKVLEAVTWRSNLVFASFYFRDISVSLDSCHPLGPFVAGV